MLTGIRRFRHYRVLVFRRGLLRGILVTSGVRSSQYNDIQPTMEGSEDSK